MDIHPEREAEESDCKRHRRIVRVVFSQEAEEACKLLAESNSKIERSILNAVRRKIEFIKMNPHYGEPIAKRLIPDEYEVTNLFWVELPNFWRMVYTLTNDEVRIIAFVLAIFDHKRYEKKFGYH